MLFPFDLHKIVLRPVFWLPFSDFDRMQNAIERMFRGAPVDYSRAGLEKCYNDWIEHVIATVPKEKLLIHNAKEGWKPICDFLGKPVPDCPYPRVNDSAGN
ncbi:Oidioi.mRNA.OKI2018_I69.chr1.g3761.t1.cds [Oikopleura dioica]|uniref:Oidioi.mRNA.OKI2018_I69.chr1.g3761.t1.cds n=1 Tax=Oikopleura dioica TaxID=34765 RepID=A0ABN7T1P4_OIKDI|nr:Oidioi.mRNA.OKI2018_I69.chr1.g3761.t1.cds [Oikopleura dioica]